MKKGGFRFEQREKESADFFLMRVFLGVIKECDPAAARAATQWIFDKARDAKSWVLTSPKKRG